MLTFPRSATHLAEQQTTFYFVLSCKFTAAWACTPGKFASLHKRLCTLHTNVLLLNHLFWCCDMREKKHDSIYSKGLKGTNQRFWILLSFSFPPWLKNIIRTLKIIMIYNNARLDFPDQHYTVNCERHGYTFHIWRIVPIILHWRASLQNPNFILI